MPQAETSRPSDTGVPPATQIDVESSDSPVQQDEFLGVFAFEDQPEERPSYANECIPECEDEIASILSSAITSSVADLDGEQSIERNYPTTMEVRGELGESVAETDSAMRSDDGEIDIDSVDEDVKPAKLPRKVRSRRSGSSMESTGKSRLLTGAI